MKFANLAAFCRRFLSDQQGHIVLLYIIMLPVTMGAIGLSLEGARLLMLNTELQDLADAAALAGAAELDAGAGARDRADTKARTLLSNPSQSSNVAATGSEILAGAAGISFYSALSSGGDTAATSDTDAAYIKVTTVERSMSASFLRAVTGASTKVAAATATAKSSYVACNVQPLMLCNPFEPAGLPFTSTPGKMFKFTPKSAGGSTFAAGDFGLVDPPGQNSTGANGIRDLLSKTTVNFCYINNVSPRPGHATNKVDDGVNVRFDLAPNGNQGNLDKTPAPNVIKGDTDPRCNTYTPNPSYRLPRDTTTTVVAGVEIGNGDMGGTAAKNTYWQWHHGLNWPGDVTTRWQAYQRELGLYGAAPPWSNEASAPSCNGVPADTYKRRIVAVAVVNCQAQNVQGNSSTDLRSSSYAEFFITEPASGGVIYTEFVQMITPQADDGKLRHVVELVR